MSQVFDALRKAEQLRKAQDPEQTGAHTELSSAPTSIATRYSDAAYLGPGIRLRGEITGNESLEIAGKIEGQISLAGHRVTIGQTAKIAASISAGEIVIYGQVDGDLRASDRLIIKKGSAVSGELTTTRIIIEEGATVKAKIHNTPPASNP